MFSFLYARVEKAIREKRKIEGGEAGVRDHVNPERQRE